MGDWDADWPGVDFAPLFVACFNAGPGAVAAAVAKAKPQELVSCKPVEERTQPEGCWILAKKPLGKLQGEVYWTLDVFPNQASAEKAKTKDGAVVEALGRTWLFTVGARSGDVAGGTRVAQIGPVPVKAGEEYTAQFSEGIMQPGAVSRTHTHSGAEVFYTEAGESCLETPDGKQVGREGTNLVVPEGVPMELVATGSKTRRGIILVLHSSGKPATTVAMDWKSKRLCLGGR